jgi:hypothetical protein
MKRSFLFIIICLILSQSCFSQESGNSGVRILFHGVVMDASTLTPLSNSQILINREFTSVSGTDGTFAFFVNRNDTVYFRHLGFKSTIMPVSDTLVGKDFVAGIYMKTDTVTIGEVVIVPRYSNLKSEIINSPSKMPSTMNNARYNVAISGYQGRTTSGKLGDPSANYGLIRQQQKTNAYEKGGIPSDQITGVSPLLLIPAAYLLIHGVPEKPAPFEHNLTDKELDQILKKYLESHQPKK